MKKIAWLCIILTIYSFTVPVRARAAAPAIGLIGAAAIGATVLAAGGTQYAQKAGGSYGFNGSHITRDMIAYTSNKLTQQTLDQIAAAQGMVQDAGGYVLGKAVQGVFDAQKAYNSDVLKGYNNVYGVTKSVFNNNDNLHIPKVGDVLSPDDLNNLYGIDKPSCGNLKVSNIAHRADTCINNKPKPFLDNCRSIRLFVVKSEKCYPSIPTSVYGHYIYIDLLSTTSDPTDIPPNLPESINPEQATDLSRELEIAISSNPQVAAELDDLMKDHPELWAFPDAVALPESPGDFSDYPPAQPITPSEISQWAADQALAAQRALINDLQTKVNANPNDLALQTTLAQETAKLHQMEATAVKDIAYAQALEAAKKSALEETEPETFDSIPSKSAWAPYEVGDFDIPARFTAMLNSVKGTALFSFSSGFFDGVPSGGSSVVTFEGGDTFGNHTIDLSDTLHAGLVAFRAVVMVIFGFLAIRAVIMKR